MIDYEEVLSNEQQDICFSNKNLLEKHAPEVGKLGQLHISFSSH